MPNPVIDEKTLNRNYLKPHIQNDGDKDVERLRTALDKADADMQAVMNQANSLQTAKADKTTTDDLQSQITLIAALVYSTL